MRPCFIPNSIDRQESAVHSFVSFLHSLQSIKRTAHFLLHLQQLLLNNQLRILYRVHLPLELPILVTHLSSDFFDRSRQFLVYRQSFLGSIQIISRFAGLVIELEPGLAVLLDLVDLVLLYLHNRKQLLADNLFHK